MVTAVGATLILSAIVTSAEDTSGHDVKELFPEGSTAYNIADGLTYHIDMTPGLAAEPTTGDQSGATPDANWDPAAKRAIRHIIFENPMPWAEHYDQDPAARMVDPASVRVYVHQLEEAEAAGCEPVGRIAIGESSSEDNPKEPDAGIITKSDDNQRLGLVRAGATAVMVAVTEFADGDPVVPLTALQAHEDVIDDPTAVDNLRQLARENGYKNIAAMLIAWNTDTGKLSPYAEHVLDGEFGGMHRGSIIDTELSCPEAWPLQTAPPQPNRQERRSGDRGLKIPVTLVPPLLFVDNRWLFKIRRGSGAAAEASEDAEIPPAPPAEPEAVIVTLPPRKREMLAIEAAKPRLAIENTAPPAPLAICDREFAWRQSDARLMRTLRTPSSPVSDVKPVNTDKAPRINYKKTPEESAAHAARHRAGQLWRYVGRYAYLKQHIRNERRPSDLLMREVRNERPAETEL